MTQPEPSKFRNNLRVPDQVFHVLRKQRGIVAENPDEKKRETRVIFDGKIYAKKVDVMDLRLITYTGKVEEYPPINGDPAPGAKPKPAAAESPMPAVKQQDPKEELAALLARAVQIVLNEL